MDEKELLKKAFEEGNVPYGIHYCFTEHCPMKDNCIHYLSSLYKNDDLDRGYAIFPNALKDNQCKYFAPLRVVKMAWGFDKLFTEVKVKDAPLLRAEMRNYLGSKGQYYRFKLGQLKLLPEQQEHIKQLFAKSGYEGVDFEYFSKEIDFSEAQVQGSSINYRPSDQAKVVRK